MAVNCNELEEILDNIVLVGDDANEMYAKAFYSAFLSLGAANVLLISTSAPFKERRFGLVRKAEAKLSVGKSVVDINQEVRKAIKTRNAGLLFLYCSGGCYIFSSTIRLAKRRGWVVFTYSNDNPFSDFFPFYYWRHYKRLVKKSDIVYVYRKSNIDDCRMAGAKDVRLLRSYYVSGRNYYVKFPDDVAIPSIVFLGHNEDDGRADYLYSLLCSGLSVGVPRYEWENSKLTEEDNLVLLDDTKRLYNEYLNRAKIALVFLSSINHDTYTRRCFEIPATKTLMISEYSDDLASLYKEDEEIVFFRSKEDLVEKCLFYLSHDDLRLRISENAYTRLLRDGNEVTDRVKTVISDYCLTKKE